MSEVKVNKISPRTACGTTTLGDSGDTFTIPSGVTITNNGTANGFGATGAVNWQTTIKTSTFTAVAGEGYFVDTNGGAITANLPAGAAGAVVGFKDYRNTFDTNALTISPNGSDKIGGSTDDVVLGTEGLAITLVFIDSTRGWLVTDSGLQSEATAPQFVTATGGTISTTPCGNFKVHTFTGPGTFCVSNAGNPVGSDKVDYLVVGAGGSGGAANGAFGAGAGGAGGFRVSNTTCMPVPQTSPLVAPNTPEPAAIPVSATGFPITVGAGGASAPSLNSNGNNGNASSFSTISSAGGGYGGGGSSPGNSAGASGGSGGGAWGCNGCASGGAGNTPPVSPPQGNNGGARTPGSNGGSGGGGAGAVGANVGPPSVGGAGGVGSFVVQTGFAGCNGTPGPVSGARYFSGGGGGASPPTGGDGGAGGGGKGGDGGTDPGCAGTANSGGGGGGTRAGTSGAGGSGIVIIRYKFQ